MSIKKKLVITPQDTAIVQAYTAGKEVERAEARLRTAKNEAEQAMRALRDTCVVTEADSRQEQTDVTSDGRPEMLLLEVDFDGGQSLGMAMHSRILSNPDMGIPLQYMTQQLVRSWLERAEGIEWLRRRAVTLLGPFGVFHEGVKDMDAWKVRVAPQTARLIAFRTKLDDFLERFIEASRAWAQVYEDEVNVDTSEELNAFKDEATALVTALDSLTGPGTR